MKMRDYIDVKETSLKLAILSSLGTDEEIVSMVNEAFQVAEDETRRLLHDEFGQATVEDAFALFDLPVADIPLASS